MAFYLQANRTKREIDLATRDASPYIPEDALPRQKPPVRGKNLFYGTAN
jgi:hypothetical protein